MLRGHSLIIQLALVCVSASIAVDEHSIQTTTTSASILKTAYTFTSTITPEPEPTCEYDCVAHLDYFLSIGWTKYAVSTTITAATLEKIIYPKYNATRTRLLPNDLPSDYSTQERNADGTVIQTVTVDRGKYGAITTVLAYPTAITEYSNSYWWHGVTPTPTGGAKACATHHIPVTVDLPSHPEYTRWHPAIQSESSFHPEDFRKKTGLDGTNYYAVPWIFPPNKDFYRQIFSNDTILQKCRLEIDLNIAASSAGQIPTKTSAWFVTVTEVRIETECRPDLACNVRREQSVTGALEISDNAPTPPPSKTSPPITSGVPLSGGLPGSAQGAHPSAAAPRPKATILPRPYDAAGVDGADGAARGQGPQGALGVAGVAGVGGIMGANTVRTEKTGAGGLQSSVPTNKKPAAAGIDDIEPLAMMTSNLEVMPIVTIASVQESVVQPSLTVGGSASSAAPLEVEEIQSEVSVAEATRPAVVIDAQLVSIGQTITIDNLPAVVTISAGSTFAIMQNGFGSGNTAARTVVLKGVENPSFGAVFAVNAAAASTSVMNATPITVGSAVLTPKDHGGYLVSGKPLTVGGTVTLGSGPSSTVLSFITDASGNGVLVSNGESTTLPSVPSQTGISGPKAAVFVGSSASLMSNWLRSYSWFWACGWAALWGVVR
ncbi:hypothetical protein EJ08DRAFT_699546 [Tothia fuscella]|uniref:Uncharacterized protein n=1 Tax=Tothia fuscella TaxID=1048955 RepID=A0A9P4TW45_9PEZI|nr:hypothetical protein EJ08DRAFT_699546 [Tothia fuscella]